ncbi:ABC transporter permease [Mannheimia granulomatis]|uniref:ABC transporter permease n=1 Tax=Mannheimia granulomatis TaxID=85402 RepID=A0A6G8JJD1_9PAST|nr:cytochrome c biogenesis protein CcsA [Mannheimia granulomatis]QIM67257.1 ABC transporter permease [Mannheimia granulomatis]
MLLPALAIVAYALTLLWVAPTLVNLENATTVNKKPNITLVFGLGMLAIILHSAVLYGDLILISGQNFTVTNVLSLMSFIMAICVTFALIKWKTAWFPLIIVYAFAICSVSVASFVKGSFIRHLQENAGLLFHLGIALFSYALFFLALIYAFQLKWLDRQLKSKKMFFCPILPPLMSVERHFFTLTLAAQAMLTLTLISGMIYLHNFFAPEHIHKAIFSGLAWLVYCVQLLGQWKLRWRGKRVLIYSISGMILLSIGYFGSRIIVH